MSERKRIYLDNQATTPVDPRVAAAMAPFFADKFGNAASDHPFGREAREAVEKAREQVAALIHAQPQEIVFTSGATESNNLAIKGVVRANRDKGDHVVTVVTEHPAVLETCRALEKGGEARVTYLRVGRDGLVDLDDLRKAITGRTVLVSVMAANNEIGVLQPVEEISKLCGEKGVAFHTDAAQAAGKIPFDVQEIGAELVSISGHKIYGPKGIGILYVRRRPRVRLVPLIDGGGHEGGLRPGTIPVPLAVGLGAACEICEKEGEAEAKRLLALRERLWKGISGGLDRVHVNGSLERRIPGNLSVSFEFVEGGPFLKALDPIAVSLGAACATGDPKPSHVLLALGVNETLIHSTVRFGIGRFNTEEEIDFTVERAVAGAKHLRSRSPLYGKN